MTLNEPVALERDCQGITIPNGQVTLLKEGQIVVVQQALGGDYTVRTPSGEMVRIAGKDADAIGEPLLEEADHSEGGFDEETVWDVLRTVYDPEIPINIVELGLIYDLRTIPLEDECQRVEIQMTLTAPGCGMGEILKQDVERKVMSIPEVEECEVDLVWEPIWGPEKMSESARLQLGFY